MNLKTTLILLVLTGAGGVGWWMTRPTATREDRAATIAILAQELQRDKIEKVELRQGGESVSLHKGADESWTLAGNWPTKREAIEQLLSALTGLETRFEPVALEEKSDLKPYGLDPSQNPVTAKVVADGKRIELTLGEGEADLVDSVFARPTYLRIGEREEVYRLEPGLLRQVRASASAYERRRLFPHHRRAFVRTREEIVLPNRPPIEAEERNVELFAGARLTVQGPGYFNQWNRPAALTGLGAGGVWASLASASLPPEDIEWYELKENEEQRFSADKQQALTWEQAVQGWIIAGPVPEQADPESLSKVLTAIPDIWVTRFLPPSDAGAESLSRYGLNPPRAVIRVTFPGGERTLLIGDEVSKKVAEEASPEARKRRYARLEGNDRVFEIDSTKLDSDVFVTFSNLRDDRVARFETSDVVGVEIVSGASILSLAREESGWKIVEPFDADAEANKIDELLRQLTTLSVSTSPEEERTNVIYPAYETRPGGGEVEYVPARSAAELYGFDRPTTIEVTVREGTAESKEIRKLTFLVGGHDKEANKVHVWTTDRPRVNKVSADLVPLVNRPALAYRRTQVLDFQTADLDRVEILRGEQKLILSRQDSRWRLLEPATADVDAEKVRTLLDGLQSLEAIEFVKNRPTADEVDMEYGLKAPQVRVTFRFADAKEEPQTLEVGKAREGSSGYYARLGSDEVVFTIKDDVQKSLAQGPLALMPTKLWQATAEDITSIRVAGMGQPEYTLVSADGTWTVKKPFDAPAHKPLADFLANSLAAPECTGYKDLDAKDLSVYGLDNPTLTVEVSTKDNKQYSLLIGKVTDPGQKSRYARKKENAAVFILPEVPGNLTEKKALDLLDPALVRIATPAELEAVESKQAEKQWLLVRQGNTWQMQNTPAGAFSPDLMVLNNYQELWSSLRADRWAAYGEEATKDLQKYGLDKPETTLTIKVRAKPNDPEVVEHTVQVGGLVPDEKGARYVRLIDRPGVAVVSGETARRMTQDHVAFVNRDMLDLTPARITKLTRKKGMETLELIKEDGLWLITKPGDEDADSVVMEAMTGRLARLRAERVAAYPPGNLTEYGLDTPEAEWHLELGTQKKTLKVGKLADEQTGERFAITDDGKAVYVLPGDVSKELLASPLYFRDRTLVRLRDADRMELEHDRRKATFARVAGTWKLTAPLETEANQLALDDFLNVVAKLRADDFVAEKPTPEQLKSFGLDPPALRWRLYRGDQLELDLLVGKQEADGIRRHAKLAQSDMVFLLDQGTTEKVLAEYRKREVWSPSLDAAQIESVRFGYPEKPFTLEKAGTGWRVAGQPDVTIDESKVNDLLGTLAGLKVKRFAQDRDADPKLYGLSPPALELEATTREGKYAIHLGGQEGGSGHRYARLADPTRSDVFVLSEEDSTKLMATIKQLEK